jgi:hypothetical protein
VKKIPERKADTSMEKDKNKMENKKLTELLEHLEYELVQGTERSLRWFMIPARSFRDAYFSASAEQILTVMILLHRWQSREPEY